MNHLPATASLFDQFLKERIYLKNGHHLPNAHQVVATSILSGLHHEYRLEAAA